jgi:hypothetical protein
MNEKIKELLATANIKFGHTNTLYSKKQWMASDEQIEKFAELIIKECSKVIVNGGYRNPNLGYIYPLTPPEIASMISEYFGVE